MCSVRLQVSQENVYCHKLNRAFEFILSTQHIRFILFIKTQNKKYLQNYIKIYIQFVKRISWMIIFKNYNFYILF